MRTILNRADEGKELRVVNDQISSPTWCGAIAQATKRIVLHLLDDPTEKMSEKMNPVSGIYHLSCQGETSWYDFAKAILAQSEHSLPSSKLISIHFSSWGTYFHKQASAFVIFFLNPLANDLRFLLFRNDWTCLDSLFSSNS